MVGMVLRLLVRVRVHDNLDKRGAFDHVTTLRLVDACGLLGRALAFAILLLRGVRDLAAATHQAVTRSRTVSCRRLFTLACSLSLAWLRLCGLQSPQPERLFFGRRRLW